jgi:hypothetical protein
MSFPPVFELEFQNLDEEESEGSETNGPEHEGIHYPSSTSDHE